MKRILIAPTVLSLLLTVLCINPVTAQKKASVTKDTAYIRVVNQRADKIVATLGITDASRSLRVRDIISKQYQDLNVIHGERDNLIKEVKNNPASDKEVIAGKVKAIETKYDVRLKKLHKQYLSKLSKQLTQEQVDQVKDGMTYGVMPITYKGYIDMIPSLKEHEKAQIKAWLIEAREIAMDAESSEKKHFWFGKYKGKINNYLSAQGYDSKKEREEWMKRIKAAEAAKKGK